MTKDERESRPLLALGMMTRQSPTSRWGLLRPFWVVGVLVLVVGFAVRLDAPGFTRVELRDDAHARVIFAAILRDGTPVTLTWRNSLFDLDVTEAFVTESGALIQTEVTFADPRGLPPPIVSPRDVDDLYHTGGPFSAKGIRRPFTRIAYRVGEIGNPKMTIGARVIVFKEEVGFGGGIVLTTRAVNLFEMVFQFFAREEK